MLLLPSFVCGCERDRPTDLDRDTRVVSREGIGKQGEAQGWQ